jgi:hypothetical protein
MKGLDAMARAATAFDGRWASSVRMMSCSSSPMSRVMNTRRPCRSSNGTACRPGGQAQWRVSHVLNALDHLRKIVAGDVHQAFHAQQTRPVAFEDASHGHRKTVPGDGRIEADDEARHRLVVTRHRSAHRRWLPGPAQRGARLRCPGAFFEYPLLTQPCCDVRQLARCGIDAAAEQQVGLDLSVSNVEAQRARVQRVEARIECLTRGGHRRGRPW